MLRAVLMTLAAVLMIAGCVLLFTDVWQFGINVLVAGGILIAALAFERWRYRSMSVQPDPTWQRTGERFSGADGEGDVDVYYDPSTGDRHYVVGRDPLP
ncbi:MAG: hypothetical protein ACYCS1_05760 [Gammaproteobacteria bacterium]